MTAKQGNLHDFLHTNLVFAENIDKVRQSQGTTFSSEQKRNLSTSGQNRTNL